MEQAEIHQYLKEFFIENDSEIIEETDSHLHVQLSIDMDKALMNRPFYWHYIENMGAKPNPMSLTLITDSKKAPEDLKGEKIHFGSPRLHQIFNTAKSLGKHSLLYETTSPQGSTQPMKPWLVLNGSVSYCCDHKKDHFFSIGLSLITGEVIEDFYDTIKHKSFQEQIPNYCFTMTPIIKPESGIERIRRMLIEDLEQKDHTWADDAIKRWKKDEELLESFYEGQEEDQSETYQFEKEAIKSQYEPSIQISIINGGLFYFAEHPAAQTMN
ncbi:MULTISPECIES: YqhG family protein [Bacillaceae]|uniref:YqhG family protein n=1 Tax=Evansella alkalicola TaxID=745819 RepID=A0ABS6K020_9BACI|nr:MULTISPECIES: YqhG family protein [Bacillaceae]MBU9724189.1 YqhG family protein [Bacillus alkalicola]